jgi:hypothetical protein
MKARTLRHIICGLTFTAAILAGLFPVQTYGAPTGCPAPSPGTAPVSPPTGGFALDGNLEANITTINIGDWIPGPAGTMGTGGSVMDRAGVSLNNTTTFHLTDLFSSGMDDNFSSGRKVDDDPNVWTWVAGQVNDKQDINNALIHFTTAPDPVDPINNPPHNWVIISADRLSTNGAAYIDFEFLQNTLTQNPPGAGPAGTFTSAGPNCGRTVGDFLLTINFTSGGRNAGLCYSSWQPSSANACGYDYVQDNSKLTTAGVRAAVNTSTIPVPYGAFGNTIYQANAFAEAAVDLTALLGNVNPCGLQIKTILVKTKESQSPTATIVDFITPKQVDLNFAPTCTISGSNSLCPKSTGNTYSGPDGMDSYAWTISGNGSIVGPANGQTVSVTAGNTCTPFTLTLTITKKGCTVSCSKTVNVTDTTAPTISTLPGPSTIECPAAPSFTTPTATDACDPSPTLTFADVRTNGCGGSYSVTRTWTAKDSCNNTSTASQTINVLDRTAPTISALPGPSTIECPATPSFATPTVSDTCDPSPTLTFNDVHTDGSCPQAYSVTRTWTASDHCGNSRTASQTINVADTTPPVLNNVPADKTVACPAGTPAPCDAAGVTPTDACDPDPTLTCTQTISAPDQNKTYTVTNCWTATDACGHSVKKCQVITVTNPNPQSACTPPYPCTTGCPPGPFNPSRTNIAFNESEVLRKFVIGVDQSGCNPTTIQVFYNDEHTLTLGVNKVTVKTNTGTTTTNCDVTPYPSPTPAAGATNPNVGLTSGGFPNTVCSQNDVDVSGRPMYPALFITDITNSPPDNPLGGDWQYGGTAIPPHAVFGTWKPAAVTVDQTKNPPVTTVTPGPDTAKNNWNLDGGDTAPAGLKNEGYGAEIRWDISRLNLTPGHKYRLYFMVHDGDQNKSGGDSGQGCTILTMPASQ